MWSRTISFVQKHFFLYKMLSIPLHSGFFLNIFTIAVLQCVQTYVSMGSLNVLLLQFVQIYFCMGSLDLLNNFVCDALFVYRILSIFPLHSVIHLQHNYYLRVYKVLSCISFNWWNDNLLSYIFLKDKPFISRLVTFAEKYTFLFVISFHV